ARQLGDPGTARPHLRRRAPPGHHAAGEDVRTCGGGGVNRPIRKVAIALAVLFLALFVNLNVVQVGKGSGYRNDSRNQRVLLNEYSTPRGQIVVQGTSIATSKKTPDELKYLRVYPNGPEFAPATGYYSFIYGTNGIEYAENSI